MSTDPATEAILADMEREVEDAVAAAVAKARTRLAALDAARPASPVPDDKPDPAIESPDSGGSHQGSAIIEITREERVALWTLRLLTAWGI